MHFPPITLIPRVLQPPYGVDNIDAGGDQRFICPMYRTSKRKGTIATDGSHSNFIIAVPLVAPEPLDVWVLRGVALLA